MTIWSPALLRVDDGAGFISKASHIVVAKLHDMSSVPGPAFDRRGQVITEIRVRCRTGDDDGVDVTRNASASVSGRSEEASGDHNLRGGSPANSDPVREFAMQRRQHDQPRGW